MTLEAAGMAEKILDNVSANPGDTHLAMVTRSRFGYLLRDAIAQRNPEFDVDLGFSESLLATWAAREAFLFFCLIADADPPTWRGWLGYKNSTDGKDYKSPRRNAPAYLQFLEQWGDEITEAAVTELAKEPRQQRRGAGGTVLWDRASRFVSLRSEVWPGPIHDPSAVIDAVFDPNRWVTGSMEDRETAETDFQIVRTKAAAMADELSNGQASGPDILRKLARRLRYQIGTRESFVPDGAADLQVTTLWGAKGVTAHHVYLLGLCDEALPGQPRRAFPGSEAEFASEQRRLFYVSITRAKKTLVLSRADNMLGEQAIKIGLRGAVPYGWLSLSATRFMIDIVDYLPEARNGQEWNGCAT